MRRIIAQARKEITQVSRDRLTITLALILPLILLLLNSTAISLSVTDLPIVIQDLDNSPASRRFIDAFRTSLTFKIVELPVGEQPEEALRDNRARGAVIIPEHFERELQHGANAEVQFMIDASDANTANIMRGAATAVTFAFNSSLRPVGPSSTDVPIRANVRLWYNPGRVSTTYIAPGMLAVGLALFPPLLAALAMSREGEQKTILQVYVSSITAREYLLGKIAAYLIIGLAEWFLGLIVLFLVYGLRFAGDPSVFLLCTVLYLFTNVCFGTMIGAAIPDQAAAIQATQLVGFLLSFLLSGAIFPVSNIPPAIRWISYGIPARYYIEVIRDALVRGGGWPGVWYAPIALVIIGAIFFLIAWRKMRWMQIDA